MNCLHDRDFFEWTAETAERLRAGRFDELDIENVAEEIESLGKSQRHELRSRIMQILEHMLKLELVTGPVLHRNQRGWRASISRQQIKIAILLEESPSLCRQAESLIPRCYSDAARMARLEYEVEPPDQCPFGWNDVLPPSEP